MNGDQVNPAIVVTTSDLSLSTFETTATVSATMTEQTAPANSFTLTIEFTTDVSSQFDLTDFTPPHLTCSRNDLDTWTLALPPVLYPDIQSVTFAILEPLNIFSLE